jgi:hypothetical protein
MSSPPNNPARGFLEDYAEIPDFARVVKRDPRTVDRWTLEPNGLPYATMGRTKLIHIPSAREWLKARMRNRNPSPAPRQRSREAV